MNQSRSLSLDFLRGIAVLMVVCHHTDFFWYNTGVFSPFAFVIEKAGWTGVDLFFVLSGFLIGGLLMKEVKTRGRLNVPRFLLRRGLKIWPAYFVLVVFAFFKLVHHGASRPDAFRTILPNILQIQNYCGIVIGHTWSIAVEEHFYLLLPVLLLLLTPRLAIGRLLRIPGLVSIAACVFLTCLALRCQRYWYHPGANLSAATELRMDSLFAGVLLAYLYHFKSSVLQGLLRHRLLLVTGGAILVGHVLYSPNWFIHTFGFTLLYIGYAAILMAVAIDPPNSFPFRLQHSIPGRIIASIGVFSYSIYLWHLSFGYPQIEHFLLTHGFTLSGSSVYAAAIVATVALATAGGVVMAFLVERPILFLRDKLFPGRASAPQSPTAPFAIPLSVAVLPSSFLAPVDIPTKAMKLPA